MKEKLTKQFFIIVLLIVLYLAALVVGPYMSFILLALVIAYTVRPFYMLLLKWMKRPWLASAVTVFLVFAILFVPTSLILSSLATQGAAAIRTFNASSVNETSALILEKTGIDMDLESMSEAAIDSIQKLDVSAGLSVLTSVADALIGVIIMFFVLYYAFKDGRKIFENISDAVPLKAAHKKVLIQEVQLITNAVIYGQLVTAIIQGVLGGIGFAIFGIPNPVFWGFIMAVLSFLPIVGTPLVFVPAGIFQLLSGNTVAGVGILIYGGVLVMNIDNVIKPFIISEKSLLNPALIVIGVLGGFKVFGFMGFILGPLVLALLIALVKVYKQDFKPSRELTEARKKKDELIIPLQPRPPDDHRKDA